MGDVVTLTMDSRPLKYTLHQYGDHELQRCGVWEPEGRTQKQEDGYWIVYIHGGAWRDPRVDHQSFKPTVDRLLKSTGKDHIAGFASIDYRLSPHSDFPQDPDNTPANSLRNAKHPDHINDVRTALEALDREYCQGRPYILVGHSAGATLAFQCLMKDFTSDEFPLPLAIIGVSGIYDLVALDDRHDGNYAGFITAAFGPDRKEWDTASPVRYSGSFQEPSENYAIRRSALLAWSPEDTLIDEPEIDAMAHKLIRDRHPVSVIKNLSGDHNQVWEHGGQLAWLITLALGHLAGDHKLADDS